MKHANDSASANGPKRESENKDSTSGQKTLDTAKLQKLNDIARVTSLHVLDSNTLKFRADTAALLELSQEKIYEIDRLLKSFTDQIFEAELTRAFVETSEERGEEIVVPAFDRSAFLMSLKSKISDLTGNEMAVFIADRLAHDRELGSTNTDIRVSIERDSNGVDRVNFTRLVLKNNAYSADIPLKTVTTEMLEKLRSEGKFDIGVFNTSPTHRIQTSGLLREAIAPRIRHLFDAADKLPRK